MQNCNLRQDFFNYIPFNECSEQLGALFDSARH
jgi:hypothetical protein